MVDWGPMGPVKKAWDPQERLGPHGSLGKAGPYGSLGNAGASWVPEKGAFRIPGKSNGLFG